MSKPELGKKLSCPSCGARFYDLNKSPAICPKCETQVEVQQLLKTKRSAPEPVKPKKPVPAVSTEDDAEVDDIDLEGDDDIELEDDDEDLIEDTSDLDEDEDEVSVVKDHIEVGDDTDR